MVDCDGIVHDIDFFSVVLGDTTWPDGNTAAGLVHYYLFKNSLAL